MSLSDLDRAVLAFARRRWNSLGLRDEAITVELGITPTAYAQRLNALLDSAQALQEYPTVVMPLRRQREARRRRRVSAR